MASNETTAERAILHCDCNSFFASVETLSHPELADVPMAVTGDPENRHGIILAKNERAKKFGVQTAETIYSAKKKCPELVCVPSHMEKYCEISRAVNRIYLDYTDLVEPFSIDESYLDITGSLGLLGKTPKETADEIRGRVSREIGITVSVGVSFCKVFAKLGSDYKKPDATTVFDRDNFRSEVWPLPVENLLFVGRKSAQQLKYMGISTIGELAMCDEGRLINTFGEPGRGLWSCANGLDSDPVRSFYDEREVKSIGNGMTFRRDISGREELKAAVSALCDELACRMRKKGRKCTVIQVSVKSPDFKVIQRQKKLDHPTWLLSSIIPEAISILEANWRMNSPVRALTVTVSGLVPTELAGEQISMFDRDSREISEEKRERVEKALTDIRAKMGHDTIHLGVYDREDIGLSNLKKKS